MGSIAMEINLRSSKRPIHEVSLSNSLNYTPGVSFHAVVNRVVAIKAKMSVYQIVSLQISFSFLL
jgi:hypothetical protein